MIKYLKVNYRAFTLLELMVVLVILAILVGIAVPNFSVLLEFSHQTEGTTVLNQVHGSQLRYFYENDGWPETIPELDIEIHSIRYFNMSSLDLIDNGSATLERNPGSSWNYTLMVDEHGNFSYASGSGQGPGGLTQ